MKSQSIILDNLHKISYISISDLSKLNNKHKANNKVIILVVSLLFVLCFNLQYVSFIKIGVIHYETFGQNTCIWFWGRNEYR